jgi:hypothetical protein
MLSFFRQLLVNSFIYSPSTFVLINYQKSYGFIRITDCRTSKDGPDSNFAAFYHPKFRRDFPEDVLDIKKIDKSKPKKSESKFVYIDPLKPANVRKKRKNNQQ